MFSGWRTTPEDALRERSRLASRDLRHSAHRQKELRGVIGRLESAIAREKNPTEKRRLVVALVTKQRELEGVIGDAQRTSRTLDTMEKNKAMCRRLDDAKALSAAMSAMSRSATPADVARLQESLLTSQSTLEITGEMIDELDRPSSSDQQSIDDQVDSIMEMMDSEEALDRGATSFPAIPVGSDTMPSPHPPPNVHDIEERLARLLAGH